MSEPFFRPPAGQARWAHIHDDNPEVVTLTVATTTHETVEMPRCPGTLVEISHYAGHGTPRSKDYSPPATDTKRFRCEREVDHQGAHLCRPWPGSSTRKQWTEMVEIDER